MILTKLYRNSALAKVGVCVIFMFATLILYHKVYLKRIHTDVNNEDITIAAHEHTQLGNIREDGESAQVRQNADVSRKRRCTFEFYKEIVDKTGDIPGKGKWTGNYDEFGKGGYEPDACSFRNVSWDRNEIVDCIKEKSIRTIAITGDSNGRRQDVEFVNNLRLFGYNCTWTIVDNTSVSNWVYKVTGLRPEIKTRLRVLGVKTCIPHLSTCIHSDPNIPDLRVVYTGNQKFMDTDAKARFQNISYTTTQHFLFGFLFKEIKADMILFFAPGHERTGLASLRKHRQQLRDLVLKHVSPSTFVIWTTQHWENMAKKPRYFQKLRYSGGLDSNELLNATNHIMMDEFKHLFMQGDRRFMLNINTFDMAPAVAHWSQDGAHKEMIWYRYITAYLFQAFCAKTQH